MSCTGAPVVLYISDLLGSFFFLKSLFGTNLGDHVDSCFFFLSYKAYGILVLRPGIKAVSPALEVQSLNHWTPGKFHVDSFCLFYCRVARVFTWGVALLRVLSGADWLHSATEAFPDCLRVFFFLFLGICFFPPLAS